MRRAVIQVCSKPVSKKIRETLQNQRFSYLQSCRRPESNRYGYHYPRDFKSRASASSATAAYGTYRARTYDPLLVRQMLSQLSYDPITTQKRLELSTSAVTGRRSNQLSHWAINGPSGTRTQDRPVMSRLL